MIQITDNESAAQAKYELERALLDGAEWQLLLGDELTATLARDGYELSVEWGKLIFAWWDEQRSQSWRVLEYELDAAEVRLRATRGLGREIVLLTLRDAAHWRAQVELAELSLPEQRGLYAQTLAQLLTQHFADLNIERQTSKPDRARSVLGQYARLVLKLKRETILAIGASAAEAQAEIDAVVAAGLVWLTSFNETREEAQRARRLWFLLPHERAQTSLERLALLDTTHLGARVECFEVDERRAELRAVRPAAQDELLNTHPRELHWPHETTEPNQWRTRIVQLAPHSIEVRQQPGREGESYLIHGLEFARVSREASFGVAGLPDKAGISGRLERLTESNFSKLASLVQEISAQRTANAQERRHPFYRLRSEAWLEALLRRDIRVLDAGLDERFVYSQIPAWRGDERAVLDLLTVNHEGRLAVLEIKAGEDAQLPLQGLDYWLRVEQARVRGEFARRGLFPGVQLAEQAPLLYLVAPRLRFHRTFAMVARCLSPSVEAYRMGLNSNWRAGVRVHTCERVNER